jgi:DNA-binding NarL/FixJ family response regulator
MNAEKTSTVILSIGTDDNEHSVLQQLVATAPDLVLAAQVHDADALQALQENKVDVALLDLGFSDTDAIELTKQIRASHPAVRVLIITASDSGNDIFSAMNAGADGYVLKSNLKKGLETAIRSVRLGAVWLDPAIAKQVLEVMETMARTPSRVLPTGIMKIPLLPEEKSLLIEVASGSCRDGVCMVDPDFVRKLRRFSPD